jgi:hypothetical protein
MGYPKRKKKREEALFPTLFFEVDRIIKNKLKEKISSPNSLTS